MKGIALVTGANRGIGLEVCRHLAAARFHVILTARNEAQGREAARGLRVEFARLDVTDDASIRSVAQEVETRFGRLDVLVNNAGISDDAGDVFDADVEAVRRMMDVNCFGALKVTRALAPMLHRSDDARVINVTSGMGRLENIKANHAGYRLSKAALNALTVLMTAALEGTAVAVYAVSPGYVRTDMGGPQGDLTAEEGAANVAWLATVDDPPRRGRYFSGRDERPW